MSGSQVLTREKLDMLAQEIADWSVRIDLATQALFTHLRMFDEHDGWAGSGFGSTAARLAWRVEMSPSAAREHVRVARALGNLHLVDEAFAAGKLSYFRSARSPGPRRPRPSRHFSILRCTRPRRRWIVWRLHIGDRGSIPSSRTWTCVDSCVAVRRPVGWCGSICNCPPSKPTSCGRRCSRRSTPGDARRPSRTLPWKRGLSRTKALPRKRGLSWIRPIWRQSAPMRW